MESLFVPYQPSTELPATRVLVLAPHPDDEVFGCGGAIMRHVELGVAVEVVILTEGTYGMEPAQAQALREVRRRESEAAAAVLGYGAPRFLDYADRGLSYGEPLIGTLLDLCRASGADLIYAPSVFEMHPDHRVLGMAALETLRRLGGNAKLAFYEVGIPLKPTHLLDISALMPRKQQAMACFPSQLTRQRYDLDVAALNRYRTYTLPESVTAAEAFMLVTAQEVEQDPLGLYRSEYQRQRALGVPLVGQDYPLVSVIVRSMDRDSLTEALDSVALQTYANIEVVLVNASGRPHRDRGAWCGRFPLRLVDPGAPLGRSAAANAGMDAARGELLIFLDDDDRFLPHHLASLERRLSQAGLGVVAAYAGIACVDTDGREHHRYQRPFDRLWLAVENYIPIHALLFRRTALANGARFDETLDHCEDWDFWLQLQDQGEFQLLPEVGGIYQVAPGTGSGLWGNLQLARAAMLKIYRKRMPFWDDELLWRLFELTHYKAQYERTVQGAVDLREQTATLGRLLVKLQQRCQQAEEGQEALRQQLAALHGSSSWRLTAPLRNVATALGRNPPLPPPPAAPPPVVAEESRLLRLDNPLQGVLQWLAPGARVLLAGAGESGVAQLLRERHQCRLTVLEDDIAALEATRPYCEGVFAHSVDAVQWPVPAAAQAEGRDGFAAVLALGTLEDLRDPWQALMRMREVAGAQGCVIATLQNAGHAAVAGCLATGEVDYGHAGPLRRGRLRFFALKQIEALFAQAGLKIVAAGYVCKAPAQTPLALQWQALPPALRDALLAQPQADVYQLALKAVPAEHADPALTLGALPA